MNTTFPILRESLLSDAIFAVVRVGAHVPTRNEIKSFAGSFLTIDSDSYG